MRATCNLCLASLAVITLLLGGCTEPRTTRVDAADPSADGAWATLIGELKAFERRIGFEHTRNFLRVAAERKSFPFCGYVSRFYLPYSYEDPAIRWLTSDDPDCGGLGDEVDVLAGQSEAIGESETPVTRSMLAAPVERMLYVVLHEDCHEQFAFPYGFEEALCNVIAYEAMLSFAAERYGPGASEYRAVERYVHEGTRHARLTVAFYQELAALYARRERADISRDGLLKLRAGIFGNAARAFAWDVASVNNVFLANVMTYSRHHSFVVDVFDALGRDLPRAVAFFRHVDAIKPSAAGVMKAHGFASGNSVDFIRAYEAAVVETTRNALAELPPAALP